MRQQPHRSFAVAQEETHQGEGEEQTSPLQEEGVDAGELEEDTRVRATTKQEEAEVEHGEHREVREGVTLEEGEEHKVEVRKETTKRNTPRNTEKQIAKIRQLSIMRRKYMYLIPFTRASLAPGI